MKNQRVLLICAVLGLAGCVKTGPGPGQAPGTPPVSLPPPPVFERTFGEVTFLRNASLPIQYKQMNLAVDPVPGVPDDIDYLFLTDVSPFHWDPGLRQMLRKDQKIIAPAMAVRSLKQEGFINTKSLDAGQQILLQKEGAHVMVSAIPNLNAGGGSVSSYLLEFDNGRNVFLGTEEVGLAVLRDFLYRLRDDGKEIYFAFIPANEDAAEIISLLQPRFAFVRPSQYGARPIDEAALRQQLKDQIFNGDLIVLEQSQHYPF